MRAERQPITLSACEGLGLEYGASIGKFQLQAVVRSFREELCFKRPYSFGEVAKETQPGKLAFSAYAYGLAEVFNKDFKALEWYLAPLSNPIKNEDFS